MPNERTIAENLIRLNNAHADIATAITEMGGTVNTNDGFEDFPDDIRTISSSDHNNPYMGLANCKPISNKYKYSYRKWRKITSVTPNGGIYIWNDGDNIYSSRYQYGSVTYHFVLNKNTQTWERKTFSGFTDFSGGSIWSDGDNIYCSSASNQYVLDKSTSTWIRKTWSGLTSFSASNIWTDGENVYCSINSSSYGTTGNYVLDKSTSTWSPKTWTGLTNFDGYKIWTDGDNMYCSNTSSSYGTTGNYVLNKATSTWSTKSWDGLFSFDGQYIWTDGDNIYYDANYVLDKERFIWRVINIKESSISSNMYGNYVWTDGNHIYWSDGSTDAEFIIHTSSTQSTPTTFPKIV